MWRREEGVASRNGKLHPYTSLSNCLNLCLEMYTCVAVDVSLDVCVVHTSINDTAATFNASEFTQYTLNRACFASTPSSASSTRDVKQTSMF